MSHSLGPVPHFFKLVHALNRGGKRCERCERCSCKDFPTGVKILEENVLKGCVKMSSVCDNSWKPKVSLCFTMFPGVYTVSLCFTLFPGVPHCFLTFLVLKCRESRTFDSAEFVVNHALLV